MTDPRIYLFAIIFGINLKCNVIIHFLVLTLSLGLSAMASAFHPKHLSRVWVWNQPFKERDKVVYQLYLLKPTEAGALCTRYDFLFSSAHLSLFQILLVFVYIEYLSECRNFLYHFEMPYYCQFSVMHKVPSTLGYWIGSSWELNWSVSNP